jgi:hypothetical protein
MGSLDEQEGQEKRQKNTNTQEVIGRTLEDRECQGSPRRFGSLVASDVLDMFGKKLGFVIDEKNREF